MPPLAAHSDPTLGYATDVGRGSSHNQDKLGFYRPDDPRLADLAGSIYVVADGMGSPERGAALADRAIRALVRAYYSSVREHGRSSGLAMAILAADRQVREDLEAQPDTQDSGVAIAAAVVRGDELVVGSVGDCRVYLLREGHPYVVSDTATAGSHMGRGTSPQPAVTEPIPLGYGDRILLATDGLHQLVDDAQIGRTVAGVPPQEAAERLIALANARGGWDNITAVVVGADEGEVRPAPVPVAATEVSWRAVALGAGALILIAALVLFRPWRGVSDQLASILAAGSEPSTAVAEAQLPTIAAPPRTPTDVPTAVPSPTVPAEVSMPDLIGSAPSDAEQFARALGLQLLLDQDYSSRVARGFIMNQEPGPGTVVGPGGSIRIVLSLGPAPAPTAAPPTFTPAVVVATEAPTATATRLPQATDDDDDDPAPPPTSEPTKEPPPTDKPPPPSTQAAPTRPEGAEARGRVLRGVARPDWLPGGEGSLRRARRPAQTLTPTEPAGTPGGETATPTDVSGTPSQESTASPTSTLALTSTPDLTATAWASVSPTASITPTATITPTDTLTPTPTNTPTDTPTPTNTPTATPTATYTPAPRYLPILPRAQWLMCDPPWSGSDDPEPNDARRDPSRMSRLCLGVAYSGRLYRNSVADTSDFFVVVPRSRRSFEILLDVPADRAVDYDVYMYERDGPELGPRGVNGPGEDERVLMEDVPPRAYYVRVVNADFGKPIEKPYVLTWRYR